MTRRIEKVNILLKEELAKIIDREIDVPNGSLITITKVETSKDIRYARIFISVLNESNSKTALDNIEKRIYSIQQMLNKRLRMRPVPKIRFLIDEEEMKRETIEKSLSVLKRTGGL